VLDLSKIEAGRVQVEEVDFPISTLMDGVHSVIAEGARAKGLTRRTDTRAVPPWLRGDPTRLQQALLNFAANAVKFTERGSVTLRAELLRDDGEALTVRFTVEDTGIGIRADQPGRGSSDRVVVASGPLQGLEKTSSRGLRTSPWAQASIAPPLVHPAAS
jgi:signal transduction histidine kinase